MKLLLLGHGRMGTLDRGARAGVRLRGDWRARMTCQTGMARASMAGRWADVDVAIDFSVAAAVEDNVRRLAALGVNVVIGTDRLERGDRARARGCRQRGHRRRRGAELLGRRRAVRSHRRERRAAARDARRVRRVACTSCITRRSWMRRRAPRSGFRRRWRRPATAARSTSRATRAGSIPGIHTVGFDGPSETITLTHTVRRSRHVRARRAAGGALGEGAAAAGSR